MRTNTQFPMAFHAMMMIANFKDTRMTSEMVARSVGCNAVTIRNIFGKLKRAGLLSVKTGTGGTSLARPAEEITLWDIYSAVETDSAEEIFKIHENASQLCPVGRRVRGMLTPCFENIVTAMQAELSCVTLAQMLEDLDTSK